MRTNEDQKSFARASGFYFQPAVRRGCDSIAIRGTKMLAE